VHDFLDILQFPDSHAGNAQARSILVQIAMTSHEVHRGKLCASV
jgi:hypothetical protein